MLINFKLAQYDFIEKERLLVMTFNALILIYKIINLMHIFISF
jgi:hypothetical protein